MEIVQSTVQKYHQHLIISWVALNKNRNSTIPIIPIWNLVFFRAKHKYSYFRILCVYNYSKTCIMKFESKLWTKDWAFCHQKEDPLPMFHTGPQVSWTLMLPLREADTALILLCILLSKIIPALSRVDYKATSVPTLGKGTIERKHRVPFP